MALEHKDTDRLKQIMDWIESLARSDIFEIRNLVAVCICETFLISHENDLPHIVPFMGEHTRALCVLQIEEEYQDMRAEYKRLFGID